jgi:hypothetical protein
MHKPEHGLPPSLESATMPDNTLKIKSWHRGETSYIQPNLSCFNRPHHTALPDPDPPHCAAYASRSRIDPPSLCLCPTRHAFSTRLPQPSSFGHEHPLPASWGGNGVGVSRRVGRGREDTESWPTESGEVGFEAVVPQGFEQRLERRFREG